MGAALKGGSGTRRNGSDTVIPAGGGYQPSPLGDLVNGEWFASNSYIRTKVATSPTIDANSGTMMATLTGTGGGGGVFTNGVSGVSGDGSTTVYFTDGSQTLRNVTLNVPYNGSSTIQVPIDATWKVGPTDQHMTIIDTRDGNWWEFQALNTSTFHANGVARSHPTNTSLLLADGVSFGTNNHISGLPLPAGLLRPRDFSNGVMNHGVRVAMFATANTFRSPAWGTDGNHVNGIPMGAHMWLPRTVNISALNTNQHILALAMQEYGMWVCDTAGSTALITAVESTLDGSSYPFSSLTLPQSIVTQMVVLAAGQ